MTRPHLDMSEYGDGMNVIGLGTAIALVFMFIGLAMDMPVYFLFVVLGSGLIPFITKLLVHSFKLLLWARTPEFKRERDVIRLERAVEDAKQERYHRQRLERLEAELDRALGIEDVIS